MKRTQVAREVADALHTAEASLEATLDQTKAALERMLAAKAELGLTGTVGDAAYARVREAFEALHQARELMIEGHDEAYAVMQATNIRGTAELHKTLHSARADEDVRAA